MLVETGETGEEKYHHGIFVDIFPYDYYESEYVIKKLQWARTTKDEKNKYPKGSLKRLLAGLYANVFCCVSMRAIETKRKYLIEHRAEYTADKCHFFSYSADPRSPSSDFQSVHKTSEQIVPDAGFLKTPRYKYPVFRLPHMLLPTRPTPGSAWIFFWRSDGFPLKASSRVR